MRVSRSRASSRRFERYAARARASSSANDDASEDDTDGDGRFVEAVASPAGMSRLDEHAVAARTAASRRRRAARAGRRPGGGGGSRSGAGAGDASPGRTSRRGLVDRGGAAASTRGERWRAIWTCSRARPRRAAARGGPRPRTRPGRRSPSPRGASSEAGREPRRGGGCDAGGPRTARPWDAARASRAETGKKIDARREPTRSAARNAARCLKSPSWLELGFPATLAASAHCARTPAPTPRPSTARSRPRCTAGRMGASSLRPSRARRARPRPRRARSFEFPRRATPSASASLGRPPDDSPRLPSSPSRVRRPARVGSMHTKTAKPHPLLARLMCVSLRPPGSEEASANRAWSVPLGSPRDRSHRSPTTIDLPRASPSRPLSDPPPLAAPRLPPDPQARASPRAQRAPRAAARRRARPRPERRRRRRRRVRVRRSVRIARGGSLPRGEGEPPGGRGSAPASSLRARPRASASSTSCAWRRTRTPPPRSAASTLCYGARRASAAPLPAPPRSRRDGPRPPWASPRSEGRVERAPRFATRRPSRRRRALTASSAGRPRSRRRRAPGSARRLVPGFSISVRFGAAPSGRSAEPDGVRARGGAGGTRPREAPPPPPR